MSESAHVQLPLPGLNPIDLPVLCPAGHSQSCVNCKVGVGLECKAVHTSLHNCDSGKATTLPSRPIITVAFNTPPSVTDTKPQGAPLFGIHVLHFVRRRDGQTRTLRSVPGGAARVYGFDGQRNRRFANVADLSSGMKRLLRLGFESLHDC